MDAVREALSQRKASFAANEAWRASKLAAMALKNAQVCAPPPPPPPPPQEQQQQTPLPRQPITPSDYSTPVEVLVGVEPSYSALVDGVHKMCVRTQRPRRIEQWLENKGCYVVLTKGGGAGDLATALSWLRGTGRTGLEIDLAVSSETMATVVERCAASTAKVSIFTGLSEHAVPWLVKAMNELPRRLWCVVLLPNAHDEAYRSLKDIQGVVFSEMPDPTPRQTIACVRWMLGKVCVVQTDPGPYIELGDPMAAAVAALHAHTSLHDPGLEVLRCRDEHVQVVDAFELGREHEDARATLEYAHHVAPLVCADIEASAAASDLLSVTDGGMPSRLGAEVMRRALVLPESSRLARRVGYYQSLTAKGNRNRERRANYISSLSADWEFNCKQGTVARDALARSVVPSADKWFYTGDTHTTAAWRPERRPSQVHLVYEHIDCAGFEAITVFARCVAVAMAQGSRGESAVVRRRACTTIDEMPEDPDPLWSATAIGAWFGPRATMPWRVAWSVCAQLHRETAWRETVSGAISRAERWAASMRPDPKLCTPKDIERLVTTRWPM